MVNVKKYLKQTVTVQRQAGLNRNGEVSWSEPEELQARVVEKQNVRRSAQGEEILASTEVWTEEEIAVGDLINGSRVEARSNVVDKRGRVLRWNSYL